MLILPFIEESQISEEALTIYTKATNPDAYGSAMDWLNKLLPTSYLCPSDGDLPNQVEKFLKSGPSCHELCGSNGFLLGPNRQLLIRPKYLATTASRAKV